MSSIMEKVSPKYCLCGPGGTRTHDVYYPIKSRVPSPLGTPAHGGFCWDRTNDLRRVRTAHYLCAKNPFSRPSEDRTHLSRVKNPLRSPELLSAQINNDIFIYH